MDSNQSPHDKKLVKESGFFDADWYVSHYQDVVTLGLDPLEHFMWLGWRLGRSPGPNFDMKAYLQSAPEARATPTNPLVFYLKHRQDGQQSEALFHTLPGEVPKVIGRNILLCGHAAGDMLFGGERSFLDIAQAMADFNVNVHATLPSLNNRQYVKAIGRFVTGIIKVPPHGWRHDQENPTLVALFEHIIHKLRIDLVYTNTLMLRAPQMAAQACGVKSICHVRELIEQDSHLSERIALSPQGVVADVVQRSTAIIGNSKTTAKAFQCKNVFEVPNPVDIDHFDIQNEVGTSVKFGIISSNIPKKGISDFVDVARICYERGNPSSFIIFGPESDFIKDLRHRGLPPNLTFAGYVASPQAALEQVNVLLSLSQFAESFGRTVAEALAARRPVIAYEWGAVPELLLHGETGYLVPYKDIDAVVTAVERLSRQSQLITSFGERGRQWVAENIAPPIFKRRLHQCLEAVIGSVSFRGRVGAARVTIIVPVYNAPDDVAKCLDSLARWTDLDSHRVLVIDDASPNITVAPLLERFAGRKGFHILSNEKNLGYTRTINKGIDWAAGDDVVLLNSDTIVTPRWLEGLIETTHIAEDIGTVTAMSDNAGAFSFPIPHQQNQRPASMAREAWAAALIRQAQTCQPVEVPTGNGFCFFIRRKVFEQVGTFDAEKFPRGYGEENEFSLRALARGWRHLISVSSYVYHERSKSFGSERDKLAAEGGAVVSALYPSYMAKVKQGFNSDAMQCLRVATSETQTQLLHERTVASDEQVRLSDLSEELIDWDKVAEGLSSREHGRTSIIICAYNNSGLTKSCLDSLLNGSTPDEIEIILVDNGSDISTFREVSEFAQINRRIKYIRNEENYNFAIGNNIGFSESTGDKVVFLNNDTDVTGGWLNHLTSALNDPFILGAQPKLLYPDGNVQCAGVVFSGRSPLGYALYADVAGDDSKATKSRHLRAVTGACLAMRARDFAGARGFDALYINGQEDIDLCLRLGAGRNRFLYVPESVVTHHEGKTTGRGKHVVANRKVFAARWAGRYDGDDTAHYQEDGVCAGDYFVDRSDLDEQGIGLWRPRLIENM